MSNNPEQLHKHNILPATESEPEPDPFVDKLRVERMRGLLEYAEQFNFATQPELIDYIAQLCPTLCSGQTPARVLDLGCGSGRFIFELGDVTQEIFELHGIDAFIKPPTYDYGDDTLRVPQTRVGRFENMEYPDEYFDCEVSCFGFGTYAKDWYTFLEQFRQVHRTLKTGGGLMVMQTPFIPALTPEDLAKVGPTTEFKLRMDETKHRTGSAIHFIEIAEWYGFTLTDKRLSLVDMEEPALALTFVKK